MDAEAKYANTCFLLKIVTAGNIAEGREKYLIDIPMDGIFSWFDFFCQNEGYSFFFT